ncbi:MAG: hypothetical protein AAGI90_00890 [Chlamydiota bacterium]
MPEESPELKPACDPFSPSSHIFDEIYWEAKLLGMFQWKDFEDLDLPPCTYPKMFRGLPRFYGKTYPIKGNVKKTFGTFLQLKKIYIDKAKLYLYRNIDLPVSPTLAMFVKIEEGEDLLLAGELQRFINEKVPQLHIDTFIAYGNNCLGNLSTSSLKNGIYLEKQTRSFPRHHQELIEKADVLLQYPNDFPETKRVFENLRGAGFSGKKEALGKNGSIEKFPFLESGRSLGLHFLEKGVLVYHREKIPKKEWLGTPLSLQFLNSKKPASKDLDWYFSDHDLNYFDARSQAAFLSAFSYVLHRQRGGEKHLDFFAPKEIWSRTLIERTKKLCEEHYCSDLYVHHPQQTEYDPLRKEGKTVRLFFLESITDKEKELLVDSTKDFLVVKNDWGFGKALLSRVPYFYDAPQEARSFLKDLISLAEYYLKGSRKTISYLRTFSQNILVKTGKTLYVEEEFFQKPAQESLLFTPQLLDATVVQDLFTLNQVIVRYFSADILVLSLIKRGILHKKFRKVFHQEKRLEEQLLYGKISFSTFIQEMRTTLKPYTMQELI